MRISIFGLGYVGAVSCGCLAELGHEVIGVDVVDSKVEAVRRGESPIVEAGLGESLRRAVEAGRLDATMDATEAVRRSEVALVCVGTPSTASGGVDSAYVERVCRQIGVALRESDLDFFVVLNRSTCLPTIHRRLEKALEESSGRKLGEGVSYACHPEFLREGTALDDFYHPPKIVFGTTDARSIDRCRELYPGIDAETFFLCPEVAAMVKYADNCFHAVKVTFSNEIGLICRTMGVDANSVMEVFSRDRKLNISPRYLRPGFAFGGSCLTKDLRGLLDAGRQAATDVPMLSATLESNRVQVERLLARVVGGKRSHVGIVGLAFKEGTDDVRESPMLLVAEHLCGKGYPVTVFDEQLAVPLMVGSNRRFALSAIPHIADLLSHDLQAVVDVAEILIVGHRLTPERWRSVKWRGGQRVIDLVGVPEVRRAPVYEGLYW